MTYEHTCVMVPAHHPSVAQEALDHHGAQGWELVAVVGQTATHWLYFKRERVAATEPPTVVGIARVMAKQKKDKTT